MVAGSDHYCSQTKPSRIPQTLGHIIKMLISLIYSREADIKKGSKYEIGNTTKTGGWSVQQTKYRSLQSQATKKRGQHHMSGSTCRTVIHRKLNKRG
jgi:hypothetical protein